MRARSGIDHFFQPGGCAIVGASRDPRKPGNQVLAAMMRAGYRGELYPVNPGEDEIMGLKCYPRITGIPGNVELVVMCAPVRVLPSFLDDLRERAALKGDVGGIICTTAGFAETGSPEGIQRQKVLLKACEETGVRLMGPNCVGVIDTRHGIDTTFLLGTEYREGGISFVSQSGALGAWLMQAWSTHATPVGFNKFVSLGNSADVNVEEVLNYLASDETTRVIGMYVEGAKDGRALMEAAGRAARDKPVVVLKTGRTRHGIEAARSHTGALAGRDQIWDAAFRQHGVLRMETVDEMLDCLRAFDLLPEPPSRKVFVLTHAGGPGVYGVDFYTSWEGMGMAEVSLETRKALKDMLPPHASVCRPEGLVDMTASATAEQFAESLNLVMKDDGVGGVILLNFPTAYMGSEEVARAILEKLERPVSKPFLPTLMCGKWVRDARGLLEKAGIPTFNNPERAGKALLNLGRRVSTKPNALRGRPPVIPAPARARETIEKARQEGRKALTEPESASVLESYGLPVTPLGMATDAEGAANLASGLGYPVAMKVVSPDIPHKTDVGCLLLGLTDRDGVMAAYETIMSRARSIPGADIHGVLVQSMVKGALIEVILGGLQDDAFGPVLMVGAGGIFTEFWRDVAFRLAPVLPEEAREMLEEVKSMGLLKGIRGKPVGDIAALRQALEAVSQAVANPDILEIDVNPLLVLEKGKGALAVDALITLS